MPSQKKDIALLTKKKRGSARLRKYWNSVHKRVGISRCVKQTTQKYRTRGSPPYSANDCCGKTMTGNDGRKYISKPNAFGICVWAVV